MLKLSFNTSHVVIYPSKQIPSEAVQRFQYISCCYLSSDGIDDTKGIIEFQYISCCYLSHPRAYRLQGCAWFQYISCCYLSLVPPLPECTLFKFQYISCCYLSNSFYRDNYFVGGFNTSHVVIYLHEPCTFLHLLQSFNTSHVVIYLLIFSSINTI